jgi:hypothetical protein
MSADATGHTFRHAPFNGSTLIVLLAIADTVNDQNDNDFWMGFERLAKKCRMHRNTVRMAVLELVETGWLDCIKLSEGGYPSRYRFMFDDAREVIYEARKPRSTRVIDAGLSETNPRNPRENPAQSTRETRVDGAGYINPKESKRYAPGSKDDPAAQRSTKRNAGTECKTCFGSGWISEPESTQAERCPVCTTTNES